MTDDVDLEDYFETYLVAVKPSVFSQTSLSEDDFDEDQHNVIISRTTREDEFHVKFANKTAAETHIEKWNGDLNGRGVLRLRRPHPDDESKVDAYLIYIQ